ncbi:MAG: hypothetical protein HWD86_10185 [Kangiellaceae bacterium]|nr:hypothetical protein [Kangiellaceae bacterium]
MTVKSSNAVPKSEQQVKNLAKPGRRLFKKLLWAEIVGLLLLGFLLLLFNGLLAKPIPDSYIPISGGDLQISFSGDFTQQEVHIVERWLAEMTDAVETVYGQFPLAKPHVRIYRANSGSGPVPWGQINRPAKSRVDLHVNLNFDYPTIRDDWTAVHELSHLLLPYAGSRDSWFSEGLASYYQNIARANAGLLSERQAWQKLYQGFRRGEQNTERRTMPLFEAVKSRRGNTMRIYWTGAAYFLMADVRLRQESNGLQSLASVLKQYRACCLPNHNTVPVLRTIKKLDQLSNSKTFSELYQQIINSQQFPDYKKAFAQLGIDVRWGGVRFSDEQTKQQLRQSITKPASQ